LRGDPPLAEDGERGREVTSLDERAMERALSQAERLLKNMSKTPSDRGSDEVFDQLIRLLIKTMVVCIRDSVARLRSKYTPREEKAKLRYTIPYQTSIFLGIVRAAAEYSDVRLDDEKVRSLLEGAELVLRKWRRPGGARPGRK